MFCFARVLDESRSLMKCPPTLSLIYTGWNFCSTTWPRILQFPATNKSSWSFQSRSGGKKTRKTSQCNSVSEHPFWPVTSTQSATVTIEQVGECVAEPDWVLQNDKKKARGWGGWKDNKRPSSVKGLQTSRRGENQFAIASWRENRARGEMKESCSFFSLKVGAFSSWDAAVREEEPNGGIEIQNIEILNKYLSTRFYFIILLDFCFKVCDCKTCRLGARGRFRVRMFANLCWVCKSKGSTGTVLSRMVAMLPSELTPPKG